MSSSSSSSSSSSAVPAAADPDSAAAAAACSVAAETKSPEAIDCTICLDTVKVAGGLDACRHVFCFDCIVQWSKVTNKCPVCAQKFKQIIEKDLNPEAVELDSKGKKKRKRKPKTVKVANKEQRISYEYTGIFNDDYDEFSDDEDDVSLNPYDHLIHFMMHSITQAMNRGLDDRIDMHGPAPVFGAAAAMLGIGGPMRVSFSSGTVTGAITGRRDHGIVDLTDNTSSDEEVQLAPSIAREEDVMGTASSSRRERRGHSLFGLAASDRPAQIAASATSSLASRSSRGARAVAVAAARGPNRQNAHIEPPAAAVAAIAAPPAIPRPRRSSELILLSDSDTDSGLSVDQNENADVMRDAIAAVRSQILGESNGIPPPPRAPAARRVPRRGRQPGADQNGSGNSARSRRIPPRGDRP